MKITYLKTYQLKRMLIQEVETILEHNHPLMSTVSIIMLLIYVNRL